MGGGSRRAGFSFLLLRSSAASLMRVRPQLAFRRQSSGIDLGIRPLVRMGRLSPDSKTSIAASQYGVGVFGSP